MVVSTIVVVLTIVCLQYARIVERNVALAHTLTEVNHDIATLRADRSRRIAHIQRLEDPQGAIPEIHDRLHMLGPNESIIYWKGNTPAPATPQP